jgi:3alpha(or 20beta)-hydroxysteroid dehydrogenase
MGSSLSGKVIIITGAGRGQGAAEADLFAHLGAKVIVTDVLDDDGRKVAERLSKEGLTAIFERLDGVDAKNWAHVVGKVRDQFGRIDGLVNNAGIPFRAKSLVETSQADWERVIQVNLTGPFLGIQAVAPLMRDSGGGSIVNIGSIAGITGHFATAYSVSKWGMRGLSKSAAMEFADWKIRVNCLHPGVVKTPIVEGSDDFLAAMSWMTPLNRPASADEIAPVVAFLLSEDSGFITGIDLPVDGGFTDLGAYRKVLQRVRETGNRI